jgi:hypothetical protein
MADLTTERRAPLLATTLGVRPLPPAARWILRGGADARAAAAAALNAPMARVHDPGLNRRGR